MSANHTFCIELLKDARDAARLGGVKIPKKLTALKSTHNLYFVQGLNDAGEYCKGDCAYSAKARRIGNLIHKVAEASK